MLLLVSSSTADPVVLAFQFRNLNLTILYFIHRYFCHFEQLQKHYWYRYRYIPIWVKKNGEPENNTLNCYRCGFEFSTMRLK